MTRGELFTHAIAALAGYSGEARLDAQRLIEHVLQIRAVDLFAYGSIDITPEEQARLFELLERRICGEPVAYLCEEAWFYGRRFFVDARVLVPRPETELLIDLALRHLRSRDALAHVADIGTGSGAIAVTLALEYSNATVLAVDRSDAALAVARANAAAHDLGERIIFRQSDLLEDIVDTAPFDVIAANLPYLRSDEIPGRPDPIAFEPRIALDGGNDGIALYRRLFADLESRLSPKALVLLEAAPPTMPALAAPALIPGRVRRDDGFFS